MLPESDTRAEVTPTRRDVYSWLRLFILGWGEVEEEVEGVGGVKPRGNQWRPESRDTGARLDGALLIFLMCLSSHANSEESKNPLIYYFIHTPHLLLIRPW